MDLPILDDCLLRLLVVRDSSESESRGGNGWRRLPPSQQTQFRFHLHFIPHHRVHNHFPYKAATKPAFRPMDSQQFSAPLPQQGFYPNPNIAPAANPPKMNTQPMPQQMMAPATFGDTPQQAYCPQCNCQVHTRVEKQSGMLTWLLVGVLALFGFWLCCCLFPFCIDGCMDSVHYCSKCNRELGVKKRL